MSPLKACATCGDLCEGTYCSDHSPAPASRPSRSAGYSTEWDKLSRRARRLQPWCTDCGATTDLSADHLPIAWERKAAGLSIRLTNIDVVCRSCNSKRGAARGERVKDSRREPRMEEKFATLTGRRP